MKKIPTSIGIATVLAVAIILFGAVFLLQNFLTAKYDTDALKTVKPAPIVKNITGFTPFKTPQNPPFIKSISQASDLKIDFHYDGDYASSSDYDSWNIPDFYTPPGTDEKFLSLSKVLDRTQFYYGPNNNNYEVFKSEQGHSYQGTPIYITNLNGQYTVRYLGFKINNPELISEMSAEYIAV